MSEGYTGETAKAGDSLRSAPSQVWRSEAESRGVWGMKGRLPGGGFSPHHPLCVFGQVLYFP